MDGNCAHQTQGKINFPNFQSWLECKRNHKSQRGFRWGYIRERKKNLTNWKGSDKWFTMDGSDTNNNNHRKKNHKIYMKPASTKKKKNRKKRKHCDILLWRFYETTCFWFRFNCSIQTNFLPNKMRTPSVWWRYWLCTTKKTNFDVFTYSVVYYLLIIFLFLLGNSQCSLPNNLGKCELKELREMAATRAHSNKNYCYMRIN